MYPKNLVRGCGNKKNTNARDAMQTVAAAFYINQAQALTYVNLASSAHAAEPLKLGTPHAQSPD